MDQSRWQKQETKVHGEILLSLERRLVMRLSRRERFLVTMLMLLLLWTGFYKLWAGPEMFRILWEWEEGKRPGDPCEGKKEREIRKDNSRLLEKLENAGKGARFISLI